MGNPHRTTKGARSPPAASSPKHKIIKPVIRVVQIHNPVYVHTDAINFPSLVQKLTGMNTRLPISHQSDHPHSSHSGRRHRSTDCFDDQLHSLHEEICRWSSTGDLNQLHASHIDDQISHCSSSAADASQDEIFDWKPSGVSAPHRSLHHNWKSCCGLQNDAQSYEESSPTDNTSGSSEGFDYDYHAADREYAEALSNMSMGVQRFSELDIWAGLASDHALPDITMLPPLLL